MSSLEDGDDDLAASCAAVEPARLDAVYRAEAPRLLRLLKRRIWAEDERSDIVQEAFVRLAQARSDVAHANPAAYLHGIVRHLLADRVRRWRRGQRVAESFVPICEAPLSPDMAAEVGEMRAQYRAAVDRLPPRTRQVYLLHRVDDLSYKQIAEDCGISVRTVEWHVATAIMQISKSIGAHG